VRADEDDAHALRRGIGSELRANVEAVPVRHLHVQEHEVGRLRARGLERADGRRGGADGDAGGLQDLGEPADVHRVVVDEEDVAGHDERSLPCATTYSTA
jgi:hypothetical protein